MIRMERRIIYAQDIMIVTGRSKSYAYKILQKIRVWLGKSKHHMITIEEYAEFHGIKVADVKSSVFGFKNENGSKVWIRFDFGSLPTGISIRY